MFAPARSRKLSFNAFRFILGKIDAKAHVHAIFSTSFFLNSFQPLIIRRQFTFSTHALSVLLATATRTFFTRMIFDEVHSECLLGIVVLRTASSIREMHRKGKSITMKEMEGDMEKKKVIS